MKFIGISLLFLSITVHCFPHLFDQIPDHVKRSDYMFVVEINSQRNYLFYKNTLIDIFDVSTGSKTRYKGNREMREGLWRLGRRMEKDLAPIYGARLIYLERYHPNKKIFKQSNQAFHGTNEPGNIGKPTSMGCVYHYDDDIVYLYSFIPKHTLVISVKEI